LNEIVVSKLNKIQASILYMAKVSAQQRKAWGRRRGAE